MWGKPAAPGLLHPTSARKSARTASSSSASRRGIRSSKRLDDALEVPDLIGSARAKAAVDGSNAVGTHVAQHGAEVVALVAGRDERAARIGVHQMLEVAALALLPRRLVSENLVLPGVRAGAAPCAARLRRTRHAGSPPGLFAVRTRSHPRGSRGGSPRWPGRHRRRARAPGRPPGAGGSRRGSRTPCAAALRATRARSCAARVRRARSEASNPTPGPPCALPTAATSRASPAPGPGLR